MAKTIIIRLGKTERYDSQNHTILWEDGTVVRWTKTIQSFKKEIRPFSFKRKSADSAG